MALIESELGNALHGPVKRKSNNTRKLRSIANRVSGHSAEVMVKVTGFGKGAGHVKAHLEYISRNGKVELENDRGEILSGKEEVKAFFKDWEKDFGDSKRHKNQRDTMHLVLSMPEHVDSESVHQAVRQFARSTFGKNHEYVFALHTDEPHPHCHLTVKMLGFDGTRLNPRKADLQAWREAFADKLRDEGVDAEATARRARGVVRKPEANVVRHIERGDKSHPPRVSKVRASKVKEAAEELSAEAKGLPVAVKPWEAAIVARQRAVRRAWISAAAGLEQEDPRLTFNNQAQRNERPDYGPGNHEQKQSSRRAAAVYQSNLGKSRREAPARPVAGMRDLSRLGVVHDGRNAQMLLRPDALHRLEGRRAADPEMRRPGAGAAGTVTGAVTVESDQGAAGGNKALASRIRAFVAAMPGIETERHQIKRDLAQRFAKQAEQARDQAAVVPSADAGQKKDADLAAPKGGDKDVER